MRKIWLALFAAVSVAASAASAASLGAAPLPGTSGKVLAITKSDRILGKPDAPVTIIEYASLSCPHCADFDLHTLPTIKKDWIDSGKAKLILRDFPLNEPAVEAAMLAHCAPRNRFYAFVNALFGSQPQWVLARDTRAALTRVAKLGGMDEKEVKQCFANKPLENRILESRLVAGKDLGVDATPTFFINGTKFAGEPPNAGAFEKLLKAAEAKAAKG